MLASALDTWIIKTVNSMQKGNNQILIRLTPVQQLSKQVI